MLYSHKLHKIPAKPKNTIITTNFFFPLFDSRKVVLPKKTLEIDIHSSSTTALGKPA